jgi:hypothetical protein
MGTGAALFRGTGRTASKVRKKHKQLRPPNVTEEQRYEKWQHTLEFDPVK